jgi:hypothetical protein
MKLERKWDENRFLGGEKAVVETAPLQCGMRCWVIRLEASAGSEYLRAIYLK